jgi:hypothetical protein
MKNNRNSKKRDRAGRAANKADCFTRAQAEARIASLSEIEEVEKFLKHQNGHVKAKAAAKIHRIQLSYVNAADDAPVDFDAPPVGCGSPACEPCEPPACCVSESLAEVLAEISEPVPLPEPVPVLVGAINKARTIKAVRELAVGCSDPEIIEAASARIAKLREARKARKTEAA